MDRTCIIVSPYFPPSTLAGVHRARHLAKHLPSQGWQPIVVCVDESYHEERGDADLGCLVPTTVEIVKVTALQPRLSRAFGVGEISLRAWMPLQSAIHKLLSERSVDTVLITGSPYYPMLLADRIRRRYGIPVVLDFQDPWVSLAGSDAPKYSKAGISHWLATKLEPRAVRSASFITSVSETQNAQMSRRYEWLNPEKMAAIPIGGDPDDFVALRALSPDSTLAQIDRDLVNISYVGTFLPKAAPLFRKLFEAVRRLTQRHPSAANVLRINLVGTSNQPNYSGPNLVMPLAEEFGVQAFVKETPERVPFLEALGILANSRGLLLIGSDEPHYTASKIYPALMSNRPFVSLFHSASSAHHILTAAGGGRTLSFGGLADLSGLTEALSNALLELITTPEKLGQARAAVYSPYTAHNVARQFADVFSKLV